MPLFHHIDLRVMWPDTDPAGIVWFGVFFRYFENAEEELYRRLGSDRWHRPGPGAQPRSRSGADPGSS